MDRKSKFLISLSTAVITFGLLYATLGPEHFNRGHRGCHRTENCCGHHEMQKCESSPKVDGKDGEMEKAGPGSNDSTKE